MNSLHASGAGKGSVVSAEQMQAAGIIRSDQIGVVIVIHFSLLQHGGFFPTGVGFVSHGQWGGDIVNFYADLPSFLGG